MFKKIKPIHVNIPKKEYIPMFEYIPKIFQCLSLHFIAETQFRTTAFLLLLKQKKKKPP